MGHPLIDRLTRELGMPLLATPEEVAGFTESEGTHCVFVPGDVSRNLETPDVAVILPELRQAFQGAFDCAVAGDAIEAELRQQVGVLKTPSLLFFRDGAFLGGVPKVRDWSDYMARLPIILQSQPAA